MDPALVTRIQGELVELRRRATALAASADKAGKESQQIIASIEALERLARPATLMPFAAKPLMKGEKNQDNEAMVKAVVGDQTRVEIDMVLVGIAHMFNAYVQKPRAQTILGEMGFVADDSKEFYQRQIT